MLLRPTDVFFIPFSLMWGGFAVFWEFEVVTTNAPFFFKLWGIPFVLVGCYFIFGRFLTEARQRRATSYGLTNERVIIVSGVFRRNVKSLNLRTLTDVSLSERSDGSGTITFGQVPAFYWYAQGMGQWFGGPVVPSFELISDAKGVYETLRKAQRNA
jgi:Bacterial PH domain